MIRWSSWVHSGANGMHYVMIRNGKTSRCLVTFTQKEHAEQQARKLNRYPWQRLSELYRTAMVSDILTLKDESMSFKSTKLSPIEIQKGEGSYGLIVWADGKQWIVAKKKFKYEIQDMLKTMRLQYTDEEIVEQVRTKVKQKLSN